jgi:hypothetical protein
MWGLAPLSAPFIKHLPQLFMEPKTGFNRLSIDGNNATKTKGKR